MATPSPSRPTQSPQRQAAPANAMIKQESPDELAQPLEQLSITVRNSSPPTTPKLRPRTSATALRQSARASSASPSRPRFSRSPSCGPKDPKQEPPSLLRKASMNSLHSANGVGPPQTPSRRSSSTRALSPSLRSAEEEQNKPLSAESLARNCLQAELDLHHSLVSTASTDLIVILNDAVYGHRFARPRTSRGALSTIVERPERIKAGVLGLSAAYVRLSGRHTDGRRPLHQPKHDSQAVSSIPFRIHKTTRRLPLLSSAVTNVHGTKWMEDLKLMCERAEEKLALGQKELQRPDRVRGVDEPKSEKLHEGDLYLCAESLDAVEGALGAVCDAVDTVFGSGPRRAFVGARPPGHHCSASHPSGFCWVNNVHVGLMHGVLQHNMTHAAIIDFDLHHGDGSQDITWNHNSRSMSLNKHAPPWKRSSIGYFSLHDINSYPCEMGDIDKVKNASLCIDNAHGQSIWNVHLESWKTEQDFWELYETKYRVLIDKTRTYLRTQASRLRSVGQTPKAAIFFSAGFDASEWESAGMQRHQVNVPTGFYARIAQDVVRLAAEEGLYVEGRVISVLEGGYSDRALCSGIMSHLSGLSDHQELQQTVFEKGGLGYDMVQKMGILREQEDEPSEHSKTAASYTPDWWSSSELDRLEALTMPATSPPRQPRKSSSSTYSSPTTASNARAVEPLKPRRSSSGLSGLHKIASRAPSPPPPNVHWSTAAHELSKLLVPADRQTDSYKAEELNAEASRARKERQSALLGLPVPQTPSKTERPNSRMSLRERKAKLAPAPLENPGMQMEGQARRRTYGHPDKTPSRATTPGATPIRRTSRRLSGTSLTTDHMSETQSNDAGSVRSTSSQPPPIPRMPPRTTSEGVLPMKKVRPATSDGGKGNAVSKQARGGRMAGSARSTPRAKKTAAAGPPAAKTDEVDQLTKGMRKIKINLVGPTQKEARDKARGDAGQASSPADPLSEPTSATPSDASLYTQRFPTSLASPVDDIAPQTGIGLQTMSLASGADPSRNTNPLMSDTPTYNKPPEHTEPAPKTPQVSHKDSDLAQSPLDAATNLFIPYHPEGPEPVGMAQQDSLTWLPPNAPPSYANTPVATPSPTKRDRLFHYTPGAIPFAPKEQSRLQKTSALVPGDDNNGKMVQKDQ